MTIANESIVDRVVARLKKQPLGDLITEEDLHDIVKQAIPKTFFEKRMVGEGYNRKELEPLIIEVMRDLLKDAARTAVAGWIVEHAETVAEQWKIAIDSGLLSYVRQIEDERARTQVRQMLAPLIEGLNQERSKLGLPYIIGY